MTLGEGFYRKSKKVRRRCSVCRFYLPQTDERGLCRVMQPLAVTAAGRMEWRPTEPDSGCEKWSRLRIVNGKPKEADLPGQSRMFGL